MLTSLKFPPHRSVIAVSVLFLLDLCIFGVRRSHRNSVRLPEETTWSTVLLTGTGKNVVLCVSVVRMAHPGDQIGLVAYLMT